MDAIFTKGIVDAVVTLLRSKVSRAPESKEVQARVDRHMAEALSWSSRVQFYGMSSAEETDCNTIALSLSREPRRFFAPRPLTAVSEDVLLDSPHHYLVLANVGAGKTTLLKRLTRKLLTSDYVGDSDSYQCPVVVLGRELRRGSSLITHIASMLAIPYTRVTDQAQPDDSDLGRYYCGDEPLGPVVARALNDAGCVLIVDGLDEIAAGERAMADNELQWLARNLTSAKIVASARMGDYVAFFEGFELLEICALARDEILRIARVWLPDQFDEFIRADLVDRPLLLAQLLFIYKRYGQLPAQPSEIYRSVVELLLREWDAERRIIRRSKYAHFDARRKVSFLAAVAYELTYKTKVRRFSTSELRNAYAVVCERFDLPPEEMSAVVAELETHTGLIAQAGPGMYEFSHLSLQEYLCADYLVRDQFAGNFITYLHDYPSPVAIAVTLAANPSTWFAAVVLRYAQHVPSPSVHAFVSRLLIERPAFSIDANLGLAIMQLYAQLRHDDRGVASLNALVRAPAVQRSLRRALPFFCLPTSQERESSEKLLILRRAASAATGGAFPPPDEGALPLELFDELRQRPSFN